MTFQVGHLEVLSGEPNIRVNYHIKEDPSGEDMFVYAPISFIDRRFIQEWEISCTSNPEADQFIS
ncbi:MAG: hypothetical protein ABH817_00610 [archaeon]